MRWRTIVIGLMCLGGSWAHGAAAQPLTADRAVQIALARSSSVVGAQAGVLNARAGVYSAYSRVLPSITADLTRSVSRTDRAGGSQLFGTIVTPSVTTNTTTYATTPTVGASWSVLNLSSLAGLRSGRAALSASRQTEQATRNEVALATRRQFYQVVSAFHLSRVAEGALRRARDDERRVRALFEVGSVSRSDVLKAQVATAQSQLDSLTAAQNVAVQRIVLAEQIGIPESELGEVDTLLTVEARTYDEEALFNEAARARPDLRAAQSQLDAARAGLLSSNLARLPYVVVTGSTSFSPFRTSTQTALGTFPILDENDNVIGTVTDPETSVRSTAHRSYFASIALQWDLFTGFATESRIAAARADRMRAEDTHAALQRNLRAEVHRALLDYRKALESFEVSERAVESATENLNLVQQKYNVGSATILELVDARVNLDRAQSDRVTALASIRVAEAEIERVRGRTE